MAESHPVLSSLVSTVAAAAHEVLADEIRTAPATPVAVRSQTPGPFIRGDRAARDGQRARRHKIIG
jgi:hypothetical protein